MKTKTGKVTVTWVANSPADRVAFYTVYQRVTTHYTPVAKVTANTAVITGLPKGVRAFFVVTAVNQDGIESAPSSEVSKIVE